MMKVIGNIYSTASSLFLRHRFIYSILLIIIASISFMYLSATKEPIASSELLAWNKKAQIFDYKEFKISYHDTKNTSKDVLLLLHGFPTSSWDWRLLWPELKDKYRLIAIDMLGFGLSDKPREHIYSIQEQADIQELLLKHLKIQDIHILAHDYGDIVAQEMVARFNERRESNNKLNIKSLVLLNGSVFPEKHKPRVIQKLLNSPIGSLVSMLSTQGIFTKSFIPIFGKNTQPNQHELNDLWYLIYQQNGHRLNHKLVHYLDDRNIYRERWVGAIQKTKIPIMMINGIADPVSGKDTVDLYLDIMPSPNMVELENIGHYPQIESPSMVLKHHAHFVEKLEYR